MKRMFVGTGLGRIAMSVREWMQIVAASFSRTEIVGTYANDRLARVLVTRLCRKDATFVDVGAHIGSVIGEVAWQIPSAKIVAIEAVPEKIAFLRRRFPKVEIHSCALGDAKGETSFFVNTRRPGYSSLGKNAGGDKSDVVEIKVPIEKLDDLLSPEGVDVIKIDVEGAELGVLRGGERLIARSRPTIMFESGPPTDDGLGYSKEALWAWFAERDYAVLLPNRVAHDGPGLSREGFLESHVYPMRTTNYLAVANERRIEVRDRARVLFKIVVANQK